MSNGSKDKGFSDPFAAWQKYLAEAEKRLNSSFNEFMAKPEFGETSKHFMQAMTKYQQGVNAAGGKYFSSINLPTRDDIAALGTQMSMLEDRLSNIEAMLGRLTGGASGASKSGNRPKRTKKPPKAAGGGKK